MEGAKAGKWENSSGSGTRRDQEAEQEERRLRGAVAGAGRACAREFVVVEGCLVSFAPIVLDITFQSQATLGPEANDLSCPFWGAGSGCRRKSLRYSLFKDAGWDGRGHK